MVVIGGKTKATWNDRVWLLHFGNDLCVCGVLCIVHVCLCISRAHLCCVRVEKLNQI